MSFRSTYQKPEGATVLGAIMLAAVLSAPIWVVVFLIIREVAR